MVSIKGVAVLGILISASASAQAQSAWSHGELPRADVAVEYSYIRANATPGQCGCFNLNGGSAEAAVRAYRGISAVIDLTGDHAGTTSVARQSLTLLTYTGGLRFNYPSALTTAHGMSHSYKA